MKFTKQDALTFLIGLTAAALLAVGEVLVKLEGSDSININQLFVGLAVGLLSAIGRYLATYVPQWLASNATSTPPPTARPKRRRP